MPQLCAAQAMARSCSPILTLALDVDTGKIVWYRQFLPNDNWNLDHTFEQVLVDIDVHNRPRQALIAIGKPGILWALDRRTGEFLWARETVYQNVFKSIDPETGKVTINESLIPKQLDETHFVCPSDYGGKLWMASAYNPVSKTLFIPLNNMCMNWKIVAQQPLVGEDYGHGRLEYRHSPGSDGFVGRVDAIDLETERPLWTHQQRPYWSSSLLVTAGGIVFGGDTNRRVFAFDAATGKVLWELPLNSQPGGFPNDLPGWRKTVRSNFDRLQFDRQQGRTYTNARDSYPYPWVDTDGVHSAGGGIPLARTGVRRIVHLC